MVARRADIAGIGADLVAETAADIGRDDMDLVFRDLGNQRHHGADDMRRLERAPDRQFALDLVEGADALAGFERRRMGAVIGDHLFHRHIRLAEGGVGQVLVAHRPFENVIVMLAGAMRAHGLAGEILAQHDGVLRHSPERIDQHVERLVLHLDGGDAVIGGVAGRWRPRRRLPVLEQHLAVGQHHLHVAGERRHPGEIDRLERLGGEHRQHARHFQRGFRVDRLDAGMGMRRADEIAMQHAGSFTSST